MRLILILTIFCLTFWGCNSTTEKKSELLDNSKSARKKFFEYDAIDYYSNNFDASKIADLYDNQSKSKTDSLKMGIILGDIPSSISDSAFINELEKIGYKKIVIDKSNFDSIDKIFVEKTTINDGSTACIYVYRDILIFKKDNKVIGTAKICFECMEKQINGTAANTENFGQDGDYEKLKKLLRK